MALTLSSEKRRKDGAPAVVGLALQVSKRDLGHSWWCGNERRVRIGSRDQRPCAVGGVVRRERKTVPVCTTARGAGAFRAGDVGAECMERIVGDEAAPDEAPEGIDGFAGIAAADGLMQRIKEAGAGGFEDGQELLFALGEGFGNGPLLRQQGQLVGEEEGDAAIALADGFDAGPGHFTRGDERVKACRIVVGDAGGQDGRLEKRCGEGRALQVFDGVEKRVEMGVARRGAGRAGPASG